MGRNPKQGIDYFQADVDMFQDRKIKRLLRSAGGKGFTIYIYLLTYVYRDKGYFYEWDEHSAFDISDELNFSENVVEEAIKACCSIGLFNEVLYSEKSVLTSESIQRRWQKIVIDANRVKTEIDPDLEIIDGKPGFLREKIKKPSKENPEKSGGMPQRKGKESKEKKSKEKYRAHVRLSSDEYEQLVKEFGKAFTESCLDKLDNYKGANGKEYEDDYRAILNWVVDAVKEKQPINDETEVDMNVDWEALRARQQEYGH